MIAANFVDVYITLVVIGVFSSGKKESSGIYLGCLMDHESTLYTLLIIYSISVHCASITTYTQSIPCKISASLPFARSCNAR